MNDVQLNIMFKNIASTLYTMQQRLERQQQKIEALEKVVLKK